MRRPGHGPEFERLGVMTVDQVPSAKQVAFQQSLGHG
jgi:hypothetical protein